MCKSLEEVADEMADDRLFDMLRGVQMKMIRYEGEKVSDRYITKQFTFQKPTIVTHIYQDGSRERVKYGYYESVVIDEENGHKIPSTITLAIPHIPVTEVKTLQGLRILFDEPPYFINYTADTMLV